MRKIERQEDRRAAVLRELERSGLSMAEFCRRHELPYGTVAAWRSTARREPVRFVEVEPAGSLHEERDEGAGALCAELRLPGGMVLRVYQHRGKGGAA